jgi:four helix bundle protein
MGAVACPGVSDFRELAVHRRSCALADLVHSQVTAWASFERWTVGIQLLRSADSGAANLAEAYGRERAADQRRLLFIARGSAPETEHWLERATARELLAAPEALTEAREIGRMLNGLIRAHRGAGLRTEEVLSSQEKTPEGGLRTEN